MLLLLASTARAATPVVALVRSSAVGPFMQASQAIDEMLHRSSRQPEVLTFDLDGDADKGPAVMSKVHAAAPTVIVAVGSLAANAVLVSDGNEPLVFSMVLYPRQSGLLAGRRPVTGASLDVPLDVQFRYVRRLLPAARRVGVLYSEHETAAVVAAAEPAAHAEGLTLVRRAVQGPNDAVDALEQLMNEVDVVWSIADGHVFSAQTTAPMILATMRRKMPFIGLSAAHVRTGALLAFSCDYADIGRQSAELAMRILDGTPATALPVTTPRSISLALNLRTAEHLDAVIAPDLQAEATEVVR